MPSRRGVLVGAGAALATGLPWPAIAAADRIVFVHGRSQGGLDPKALKESWISSLAKALEKNKLKLPNGVDIRFPYYGDELDEFVKQSKVPLTSEITSRGDQTQDELLAFQAAVVDEMLDEADVPDALLNEEYGDNPKQRGPLNWEWVQASIRALDRYTGLSASTIETFTRDVFIYLSSSKCRKAINATVGKEFVGDRTVIVAHSLGTVVSYDILRSQSSSVGVPLFLTLGSPLGIRPIRNLLQPIKAPRKVNRWLNCFDERDFVALYALDKDHFGITPPIENFAGVKNSQRGHHAIVGYLADPRVSDEIFKAVQ